MSEQKTRITITVDPELADLIPDYLENRRRDLAQLRELLAAGDFETVRRLGHDMKGSGGGYGFEAISEYGSEIERAARVGNKEAIERSMAELAHYLAQVEVILPA